MSVAAWLCGTAFLAGCAAGVRVAVPLVVLIVRGELAMRRARRLLRQKGFWR